MFVLSELHGGYTSRTQIPWITRGFINPRVCLWCLWVSWHCCERFWVGCASSVYAIVGSQARGRLCVCNFSTGFFCDVVCGSLSGLLGWEASWSENTCGEGGGVTRAMWASDPRDQPQAVCECLPSVCLSGSVGLQKRCYGKAGR